METLIIWALIVWVAVRWFERMAAVRLQLDQQRAQDLERRLPVRLTVEQMQGMIYCWDSVTNDFVCQGRDLAELRDNFARRYPDRNAAITHGPEELVTQLKHELRLLKQNENLSGQ
jgi:hypothetical protein